MKSSYLKRNLGSYLFSMRWHYSFISGLAGYLGIVFYYPHPNIFRQTIILAVCFIGWGVNQVINDYLGLAEDRLNAPNRPLVTGRLDTKFALTMSLIIFIMGLATTYWLNKEASLLYLSVFFLNIIYERIKRMPLLGNIIFGFLVVFCVYYGAMCINKSTLLDTLLDSRLAALGILVWLINFVLCFFTDFKDFKGDKKTNIKTLVVLLGPQKAKHLGVILIILPFLCLYFFLKQGLFLPLGTNLHFFIIIFLAFLSFLYPALSLNRNPKGRNAYYSLIWVVMGVILFETALIGLIKPYLSLILLILTYACIRLLFNLYKDCLA